METEEQVKQQIRDNPYQFICDYVESIYPQTGRRVFEVLALMPVTLIIPDLTFMSKKIRSNINVLFLAPSGSGKTSLADLFATFTYAPLKVESITAAKLETVISNTPMFSLIVGDFARMSHHQEVIKVIEGLLGEEKRVSRKTMRTDIDMEAEGIGLLCGVATDLHFYILGGLIFRVIPILLGHDVEEHSDIGKHLREKIGSDNNGGIDKEKIIRDFYYELLMLQDGRHKEWLDKNNPENKDKALTPVIGYEIAKHYRDESFKEWDNLTQPIVKELNLNFFREYQEFYRILIAHAFLNIHKRRVVDGVLYPNDDDFKVALRIMKRTIIFKYRLMKSEKMAKGISSAKEFARILESDKIPEEYKKILRNLVKVKGGRVVLPNKKTI